MLYAIKVMSEVLGKNLHELAVQMKPSLFNESSYLEVKNMLKAKCIRLSGHNLVIGNTVFSFDKDGLAETPDLGNARYDFEALLKLHGVHVFDPLATDKVETIEESELKLEPEKTSFRSESQEDKSPEIREPSKDTNSLRQDRKEEKGKLRYQSQNQKEKKQ